MIVGVSQDTRSSGLGEPAPSELFLLHEQLPVVAGGSARAMYLVMRTSSDPMALATVARNVVREMDPQLAIAGIWSMDDVIKRSVARPRFTMTLLAVFGLVALALAAVGIYGIMSYGVKRRTREIGIRMALGAQPRSVLSLIVKQGMTLTIIGLVVGVASAFALTQLMTRMLFGISATDPITYITIALLLSSVAFIASWIPARRAVRTDPSVALRVD
jgi:putative ABC transport system permease protein